MAEATGLSWKGYEGQDYEQFWTGPGKKYLDELEHAIISKALPGGDTIVDIGAGFGRLGNCYVGRYHTANMVEPANNLREAAKRTYGDSAAYHEASATALPFPDSSHDAALLVRVFHHLDQPEPALREIHRVLKPGGILIFNYSNKRNLKRVFSYWLGRSQTPFSLEREKYGKFLIGHHPDFVQQLLNNVGFTVKKEYGAGIEDKLVNVFPFLSNLMKPSVFVSSLFGTLRIAPIQFVLAQKK